MRIRRVGILTAGGIAPCLSAAVGSLIAAYGQRDPAVEIRCYRFGYAGLLRGDSFAVTGEMRRCADRLLYFGGSVLGNSRVKLENQSDCLRRRLVEEGQDPQAVAAERLAADGIDVLHTIGGDDTSAVAAGLAERLAREGHPMAVIGLPKTVDNDIHPIVQTLGAATAAEESAKFFTHAVNECTTNPHMLVVHEVMGRNCGWLTAEAALRYRSWLDRQQLLASIGLSRERWDLHGVYLPELELDIAREGERLARVMAAVGNVNIFVSEGAGVTTVLGEMEREGRTVPRDAFGHVQLDRVNLGQWLGERLARDIGAEKLLVQKSGYFARSSAPNAEDLQLIRDTVQLAVGHAFLGGSGVVGRDREMGGQLALIDFSRIRGGQPFDPSTAPFRELLLSIGQVAG
ncbi:MAG: pyrophosphate--fructose-6-phosphate 1-phosphotransferase [Puniceicoccales bacterium]|nr:pyrophosphate--fructose-6-phosphate 1-phosphotransferase [Puniceicoccales bacterium]